MLSLYNTVGHLSESRPVRVSVQAVRDSDYSHFHDVLQLCFVLSGELHHTIDGKEYIQTAGTCAFLLPFCTHILDSKVSEDTPVIVHIWFHESFLSDFGINLFSYTDAAHFEGKKIPEVSDFGENKEKATSIIRRIIDEFNKDRNMSLDIMRASLGELFRLAASEKQNIKATPAKISRFKKIYSSVTYMCKHFREKLDTDTLAEISELPRRTFTENFKTITKLSPNLFLISIRLSKAISLFGFELLHDEIARKSGLSNHANLARTFRKYLGVSPTEFFESYLIDTSIPYQKSLRERYPFLAEEQEEFIKTLKA